MKYIKIDDTFYGSTTMLIEGLSKLEILEKELKGSQFKVTGISFSSDKFFTESGTHSEKLVNILQTQTGLEIQTARHGSGRERIVFVLEQIEE